MALQLRHTRKCVHKGKDLSEASSVGCTCKPTYKAVFVRDGKLVRTPLGKDKKEAKAAEKRLRAKRTLGKEVVTKPISFAEWADLWVAGLKRPNQNTLDSYGTALGYAKEAFGPKLVRELNKADILRFLDAMTKLSASTQAKHLRVVQMCLDSAVGDEDEGGYATSNPARKLKANERPRVEANEAPYFLDGELAAIFAELREPMHWTFFQTLLRTGMREGELVALTWADVDFPNEVIHVARSYSSGKYLGDTKSHRVRDVALDKKAVQFLAEWWKLAGSPEDNVLVFPGVNGFLDASGLSRRVLYPAMARAGVPREMPEGRARGRKRTVHSFRHTHARIFLENGGNIYTLKERLGHSSVAVTDRIYAHMSAKGAKREARRVKYPV